MDRGRVGEDRGSKETDRCPLTPFRLEDDVSGITTGVVLSHQQVDDNAWHPVAFLYKAVNTVERNFEIHDTEILAII
jgi:hypothetical protein